jgi:hypothetical protein
VKERTMPGSLYVKYAAGDSGIRPIPPGTAFWASPSVWLTDAGGNPIPCARVGVDNWIHVQVDSTVDQPRTGVKSQVWVCDYTAGYIGPDVARASSGGAAGRTGTVSTAVSSAAPGVTHVTWRPTAADLINSANPNEGHLCVGVNIYAELPPPPEGAVLSSGRLDVINNAHHGWHNITVTTTPLVGPHNFAFRLTNPGVEAADFGVEVWENEGELGQLEQETLLGAGFVDLVDSEPMPDPVPPTCQVEPPARTWLARGGRLVLRGMPEQTPLRPAGERAKIQLVTEQGADQQVGVSIGPGEHVPVVLQIGATGQPGDVHVLDVAQRDRDGLVLGGGRILVVEVPEWHCC